MSGRYGGGTAGTFRAELRTAAASDDGRVITMHTTWASARAAPLDVDCRIVFEAEDGRIVSGRERFGDLYAWDAFWAQHPAVAPSEAHETPPAGVSCVRADGARAARSSRPGAPRSSGPPQWD